MEYLNINSKLATDEQGRTLQNITDRKRAEEKLQLELFQKDVPEALEFIESSANRMDRLIKGILKLSRLGRQGLKPEPVDYVKFKRGDSQHGAVSVDC